MPGAGWSARAGLINNVPFDLAHLIALREYATGDLLVRIPISGAQAVAEWRLHQFTAPAAGWSAPSNCWAIYGLRVINAGGVAYVLDYQDSAWEYAYTIGIANDPQVDFGFYGSLHQAQILTSMSLLLDGADVSGLGAGQYQAGSTLVLTQAASIILPKDKTSVIGSTAMTTTFAAGAGYHVQVAHQHTYNAGYQLFAAYSAMMPSCNNDLRGIDTYQCGANAPATRVYDNGVKQLNTQSDTAYLSSTAHPYKVKLFLPDGGPDVNGSWAKAGNYKMWLQDRGPEPSGVGKVYVNWVSTNYAERVTAVNSSHRTQYTVEI